MVKKIRPTRLLFATASVLILHLAWGCAGASRTSSSRPNSPIVGQWRQTTLGVGQQSKPCPASFVLSDGGAVSCGGHDTLEFKSDGTFIAKFSDRDIQAVGSWRLQGSSLLVTFAAPPEVAGVSRSTTIDLGKSAESITIKTSTGGTATAETYVRE